MNAKTNSEELEIDNLSDIDLLRYNKHILLDEINEDGQKKLLESHVVLIGLGGLGCPVALYLSASGIGKITIIDHDDVELSNLQRQILFNPSDVGKNKAYVVAKKLKFLNPMLSVYPLNMKVDENFDTEKIKNRNLAPRISDQEKKLHEEFIQTLGENSIWKKINQSKNNQTSE